MADDIMEPYRPFVDSLVFSITDNEPELSEDLTTEIKAKLLSIPTIDVVINKKRSPLMIAAGTTTYSLVQCFEGKLRKIKYPEIPPG